jgi:hypothetical protein
VIYHLNLRDHTGLVETHVFAAADDEAAIGRARGLLIAGDQGRLGYLSGHNPTGGFRKTQMCRLAFDGADPLEGVVR